MTLIDLMQAFHCVSVGVLDPYEQALWLRLALIWNSKRRIDWFLVSRVELIRETGIKSKDTVDKARKGLEKKGFIQSRATGRTSPRMYHMEDLTVRLGDSLTRLGDSLEENFSKATTQPSKATTQPRLGYEIATSQSTEIYTEYTESLSKDSNDIEIHRPPERETPSLPPDLLKYYMERFNPEPKSREKEKLAIWAEQYTKEKVKEAIDAGAENGASHINYIGAILRNGGTTNGNPGRQRQAQRRFRQPTEEERRAKWDAEARKYGAGTYAHRGAAGVCGDQETVSEGDIPGY
ncbi:MAG: hypothetical protein J6N51_13780 [Selenomonas sp.]|nr:hypothetical protein [Selenomonas sp.]